MTAALVTAPAVAVAAAAGVTAAVATAEGVTARAVAVAIAAVIDAVFPKTAGLAFLASHAPLCTSMVFGAVGAFTKEDLSKWNGRQVGFKVAHPHMAELRRKMADNKEVIRCLDNDEVLRDYVCSRTDAEDLVGHGIIAVWGCVHVSADPESHVPGCFDFILERCSPPNPSESQGPRQDAKAVRIRPEDNSGAAAAAARGPGFLEEGTGSETAPDPAWHGRHH